MKRAEQTMSIIYRTAIILAAALALISIIIGSNHRGLLRSPSFDSLQSWLIVEQDTDAYIQKSVLGTLAIAPILSLLLIGIHLLRENRRSLDGWLAVAMVLALIVFIQAINL